MPKGGPLFLRGVSQGKSILLVWRPATAPGRGPTRSARWARTRKCHEAAPARDAGLAARGSEWRACGWERFGDMPKALCVIRCVVIRCWHGTLRTINEAKCNATTIAGRGNKTEASVSLPDITTETYAVTLHLGPPVERLE